MAFVKKRGKTKMMYFIKTASTAINEGDLVTLSSGQLVQAGTTTAGKAIVGVARETIASTDADYATARLMPVEVPVEKNVEWEAPVNTGTLATTSVGLWFDLEDQDAVDQSASTYDIVQCTKFIAADKGEFILNIGTEALGVE